MERYTAAEFSRFNSKWKKRGDCHLWESPLDKDGYGTFFFRRKPRRAHRVSYYIHVGDIPDGLVIDHTCGNRNCVNPSHLRAITVRENALENSRGIGAVNAKKTHCKLGHKFDRKYAGVRYCSVCDAEKKKRLRKKWYAADTVKC